MIKNERQYKITRAAMKRFEDALAAVELAPEVDRALTAVSRIAVEMQYRELRSEVLEYESLRSGNIQILTLNSLHAIPEILVRARIAAGLSQKDLAAKVGIKEQQIQRYEESNYEGASLARLSEIATATNLVVQQQAVIGASAAKIRDSIKSFSKVGLPSSFITRRLVSEGLSRNFHNDPAGAAAEFASELASRMHRIFGWSLDQVLGNAVPTIGIEAVGGARFKIAARRKKSETSAYSVYAHYLAMLVLEATEHLPVLALPNTTEEFYEGVCEHFGVMTFKTALKYVWMLGIPVLPLADEGTFDGAYWRVNGRHVIVLKQATTSSARWLFDLLHDYCHATQHPGITDSEILESPPMDPIRREDPDEVEAFEFAADVILAGNSGFIISDCEELTRGRIELLKSKLPKIAEKYNVDLGAAANFMAHKLSASGVNWWGAANNLQNVDGSPWSDARDLLLEKIRLQKLNRIDREILYDALSDRGYNNDG